MQPRIAEPEKLAPELALSVNGTGEAEVLQGWPVLVKALVLHPRAYDVSGDPRLTRLVLPARQGAWSNNVRVEVTNARGQPLRWPFHPAGKANGSLSLDAQTAGELGWWLTSEETARLAEGDYRLVGVLDTSAATERGYWKGKVSSVPVAIRVCKKPASLSESQLESEYLLLAGLESWRGNQPRALAHVDELLAKQPLSVVGLTLKGDLFADEGNNAAAFQMYNRAINAHHARQLNRLGPSTELVRKR